MTTANLAELLPRLDNLRGVLERPVCLQLEMWVGRPKWTVGGRQVGPPEVVWGLWDGSRHFYGPTPLSVLQAAEVEHDIAPASGPLEAVTLPDVGSKILPATMPWGPAYWPKEEGREHGPRCAQRFHGAAECDCGVADA